MPISEHTPEELLAQIERIQAEDRKLRWVMKRVLWWIRNRGDATSDHAMMHPCQIADAALTWLEKEGIDLDQ